jgi:hypothetical protein
MRTALVEVEATSQNTEPVAKIVLSEREALSAIAEALRLTATVQDVGILRTGPSKHEVKRLVAKVSTRLSFVHHGYDVEYF